MQLDAAAKVNNLVRCNLDNNVLSVLKSEQKDSPNSAPAGILLVGEEIPAGTTKSFFTTQKVIGFKFSQV